MKFKALNNGQWKSIELLFPPRSKRGRPRADDRRTINAILFVLKTEIPWNDLPQKYGDDSTANRRLSRWKREGVWKRIMDTLASSGHSSRRLHKDRLSIDGDTITAKKGTPSSGLTDARTSAGRRYAPRLANNLSRSP